MTSVTISIIDSIADSINSTFSWLLYSNNNVFTTDEGTFKFAHLDKVIVIDNSSNNNEKFNEFEMITAEFDNEISNVVVKTSTVSVDNSFHSSNEKQLFAQMVAMSD